MTLTILDPRTSDRVIVSVPTNWPRGHPLRWQTRAGGRF